MGIDAEMFIKIKGQDNWITQKQTGRLAYDAAEAFGHDMFWIFHGPGYQHRAIEIVRPLPTDEADEMEIPELAGKSVMCQDGPPIVANEDEQFVRVHPATRYYGPGYERGALPFLLVLAKWLEARVPQGEIWYGGDSSGVLFKRFDQSAQDELFSHFAKFGHKPYNRAFSYFGGGAGIPCDFCGGAPMNDAGGGGGTNFQHCAGCGKRALVNQQTRKVIRFLERKESWHEAMKDIDEKNQDIAQE